MSALSACFATLGCQNTDRGETNPPMTQEPMAEPAPEPEPMAEPEPEPAAEPAKPPVAEADRTFIEKAARGGAYEVALGQLAVEQGSSAKVKEFGQRMVDDHGKANQELAGIAMTLGVEAPAEPDAEGAKKIEEMRALKGKAFDKRYMADMVADHQKDVDLFKAHAAVAQAPELDAFVDKTLPILEDHLAHAKAAKAGKTHKSPHQNHGADVAKADEAKPDAQADKKTAR